MKKLLRYLISQTKIIETYKNILDNLAQLDFIEDIFHIRMILTNNDLKEATETGIVGTLQLPESGL